MTKKKIIPIIILLFAIFIYIFIFVFNKPAFAPEFSHISGFYDNSFYLEISAPAGTTVYYTLDGSTPDENSFIYTEPLFIENASDNPNVYSAIEGISVYQVVAVPDYSIDKCTVIRAIAVSPLGLTSTIASASYFVGLDKTHYSGCNVISLITPPENLFDYEKGIYMLGKIFNDYSINGDTTKYPFYWSANYNQRGYEWERDVLMQFFDTDGAMTFEKKGGIRIRGGTTRAWGKKGFNLFSRPQYDGTQSFGIPLFDSEYIPDSVSLLTGGNQPIIQFHDYAVNTFVRPMNVVTTLYQPYIVYINGEYWGFYWLSEKLGGEFFQHYYGTAANNTVMIKNKAVEIGESKDKLLYDQMIQFIENSDMSIPENYCKACEMIDMESCLDYYASMIYIARCNDWPHYNVAMWRSRESVAGEKYSDGKWRFIIFDCNSASIGVPLPSESCHNTLEYSLEKSAFFRSLWANSDFRAAFEERILFLADTIFAPEKTSAFIDAFSEKMYPVLEENWNRFYTLNNEKADEFHSSMNSIKTFFETRKTFVVEWFE